MREGHNHTCSCCDCRLFRRRRLWSRLQIMTGRTRVEWRLNMLLGERAMEEKFPVNQIPFRGNPFSLRRRKEWVLTLKVDQNFIDLVYVGRLAGAVTQNISHVKWRRWNSEQSLNQTRIPVHSTKRN